MIVTLIIRSNVMFLSIHFVQDGFYSNSDSQVTAPGILLIVSSLGITALFALGPGGWILKLEYTCTSALLQYTRQSLLLYS